MVNGGGGVSVSIKAQVVRAAGAGVTSARSQRRSAPGPVRLQSALLLGPHGARREPVSLSASGTEHAGTSR